ncbi:MAG: AAA family ATPase [Candidatus Riflebacteria bacterium HGW-Riflebacteria-1]|jgi:ATP-dependent 26S proteasome regulatory subunit|nr:MAG: AAA family ATPase [Candidatus Riflebacteria bacterium HGW-Riflebacteria-1]
MSAPRKQDIKSLKEALTGGYPIIAIETWEEDATLATLQSFFNNAFQGKGSFLSWDLQSGLVDVATGETTPCSAIEALDKIQTYDCSGFFVFKDLNAALNSAEIQRRLRNIHFGFRGQSRFLLLTGSSFTIPGELRKDIVLIDYKLPEPSEVATILDEQIQTAVRRGAANNLSLEEVNQAIISLKGFTAAEIRYSLNKALWGRKSIDAEILPILQDEKEQLARKDGVLEYVRAMESLEDVGGLENLKEWLVKRRRLFSPEAAQAGLNPPRGLLMMGISGCGKSLSVKAISSLWGLPLFRLDMNKVYSGNYGTPEGTFYRAIKSIESVAPAILWIDEIEGGISSNTAKDGGTGSHIFSAFLTWMQEKSAGVFVAATANRIDLLPAEIIRKGRFDQVFFIDLPNDSEREAIFRVHLKRRGNHLEDFDLPLLSVATEFWNGAEIEHVVEAATIEAFHRGNLLAQDDLYTIIRSTVPLSRTMSEQIKFIKNWASERAISASHSDK